MMEIFELSLILLVGIQALSVIEGRPSVKGTDSPSDAAYLEVDKFLKSYGYYPSSGVLPAQVRNPSLTKHSKIERTKALKLFQKFYNLPQSGKLDKETTQLMQLSRCGHADISPNLDTMDTSGDLEVKMEENDGQTTKESKNLDQEETRFNVDTGKRSLDMSRKTRVKRMTGHRNDGTLRRWKNYRMSWSITKYSDQKKLMPKDVQRNLVRKAVSTWQPILPFKFEEKAEDEPVDMRIVFHTFSESSWQDKEHRESGWRKGEKLEGFEEWEIPPDSDDPDMISRIDLRDDRERQLKRKWNRTELDRHNSARRINRTKIKRPKNAPIRKGSHAHAMVPVGDKLWSLRDIHIDDEYDWSNHQELLSVLLHEIGHSLGLGHTSDERAVMYPFNRDATQLALSDIEGIERLYGSQYGRVYPFKCAARLREVDNIFWDPTSLQVNATWFGTYYVISGKKLQYVSVIPGVYRTYRLYEMIFHDAPSKYDVVFPHRRSNSVFFIEGKTIFEYFQYTPMPVKTYTKEYFPETPKLSISVLHQGRDSVHLLGDKYRWSFEFTHKLQKASEIIALDERSRQAVANSKFAVQWIDGNIYVVKQNGSWFFYNKNENNRTDIKPGYPAWMERLMCRENAASIGMPTQSLVLVIILSLITLS